MTGFPDRKPANAQRHCLCFQFRGNKLPQILWLKIRQIYALTGLGVTNLEWVPWGQCPGDGGAKFLLPAPRKNLFPAFSSFTRLLPSLAVDPSSNGLIPTSASVIPSPSLTLKRPLLPPPSYKDPCDYTGPTWIIQHNFLT